MKIWDNLIDDIGKLIPAGTGALNFDNILLDMPEMDNVEEELTEENV